MCEFCESLIDKTKEITWHVRSRYANDNICEFVTENNCDKCIGCNNKQWFVLSGIKYEDGLVYVGIEYNQELINKNGTKVFIRPFSENIQFNFCPICGKQISQEIKDWDKYYDHQITIDDK